MRLIESLATTEALAEIFSDRSVLQAMLAFEAALAVAEAQHEIIPKNAARVIARAAREANVDPRVVALAAADSATPAIPLIKAFTESVRQQSTDAAHWVHWGATSQDVCDTAVVLLLKKARPIFISDLRRLEDALRSLAKRHRHTVMLSRTLLQPAPPVTFGLKAAGWLAAIHRSRMRLESALDDALVLQFGGASGTLAALGKQGVFVAQAVAKKLKLTFPDAPWHAHRDRLATLVTACGVLAGTLGKMARDIILLMQSEVGEVSEGQKQGGGGSSTLPHKHNPTGCVIALAATARMPSLVSGFLAVMPQEHERGAGGWQAEWPIISDVVQAIGRAIHSMATVAEQLIVDGTRMRQNIAATRGAVFAERAMVLLGQKLGRDTAYEIVQKAVRLSNEQQRNLSQVLKGIAEVKGNLDLAALKDLEAPEHYLGAAEEFQQRLLTSEKTLPRRHGDAEKSNPNIKVKSSNHRGHGEKKSTRSTARIVNRG